MQFGNVYSTEKANCAVCGKRTGDYQTYSLKDGVQIRVPVCEAHTSLKLDVECKDALRTITKAARGDEP